MLKEKINNLIKYTNIFNNAGCKSLNVFHTFFNKNVLIFYINDPFKNNKCCFSHSNFLEAKKIAEVFKQFNYNVDVYHWFYNGNIDYTKYDVIFGFGNSFEKSFYTKYNGLRIYYATGAHSYYQNNAEMKRVKSLKERRGILLTPRRAVPYTWSASTVLSNAIISLGNEWTASTYKEFFDGTIYNVNVSAFNFYPPTSLDRNWEFAKKNFLWMGSGGLVHKGLDLCLDVFKDLPDLNLHICGPKEEDFFKLYHKELQETPNIYYHGFVDISSENFKNIVKKCGFLIYPSCSEGQAGSVITSMFTGLLPIITKQTGVDIGQYGFLIEDESIDKIRKIIKEVSKLEDETLINKSKMAYEYCAANHTIEIFKNKMTLILEEILFTNQNEFL